MQKTKYYSYKLNSLAKGCQLCIQGRKSVFFITGICPEKCFYCPISDQKKNKDVVYINEWPTGDWKNIKKEIRLCKSKGVGITGGDPLARLQRTLNSIKKLKKEFGRNFHIHLYTPLTLVDQSRLKKLYDSGLDEIRFHPNLENPNKETWKKITLAKKFPWKTGIEIPAIPKKEKITKQLIDFLIKAKVDFLNLNELEYSDTNADKLAEKGFKTKDARSYAIKGSQDLAFKLIKYIEKKAPNLNIHYCTATLKDKVQMRKRIKLRANSIKKSYDSVSEDGTLIRGIIYLNELAPLGNYKKKINSLKPEKKQKLMAKLKELKSILKKEFNIENIETDRKKFRLLASVKTVKNLAKKITPKLFKLAIVEEYPTYDEFEVEIIFL